MQNLVLTGIVLGSLGGLVGALDSGVRDPGVLLLLLGRLSFLLLLLAHRVLLLVVRGGLSSRLELFGVSRHG
ncbi:hypothetical protein HD553DRAFT_305896 [Filobasidium floriforme]|uniref:uncharacterized protein n=1 Tax=Filobasidium floriforme TaxID=5210 RepID=UPI001E8D03B1|nr:uncharacterized protein HD553DRAFT_305896 [Filobasidium floriforme]KAH8089359.1 hypothetical protein HD553DRAFT_305896 [Filobasidium floriforme]